jgi:hypothetical protein
MQTSDLPTTIVNKLQILPRQKQQQFLDGLEDENLLTNISPAELQALAQIAMTYGRSKTIAPAEQAKLSDLLARNTENQLSTEEVETLDRLLDQLDQLNILKARAQYTLQYFNQASAA